MGVGYDGMSQSVYGEGKGVCDVPALQYIRTGVCLDTATLSQVKPTKTQVSNIIQNTAHTKRKLNWKGGLGEGFP